RLSVALEGKPADTHGKAAFFGFLFGDADTGHLRAGVDAARDGSSVGGDIQPRHGFDTAYGFMACLVRQHGGPTDVSCRVYAWFRRTSRGIDGDEAGLHL